jgi:membrane-associated phospholipid phosphatase
MKIKIIFSVFFTFFFTSAIIGQGQEVSPVSVKDSDSTNSSGNFQPNLNTGSERFLPLSDAIIKPPKDIATFFMDLNSPSTIQSFLEISAATGALNITDHNNYQQTRLFYFRNRNFHRSAAFFVNMGNGNYHLIGAAGFVATGLLFNDDRMIKTGGNILESMLASGALVQILKRISGRESPIAATQSTGNWRTFPRLSAYQKNQPKYYSFPSGHLTTTVSTLTVLANNFPECKWLVPAGYVYSAAVGAGLVAKGMHWYSDFPLAVALGYSFGNLIAPPAKDTANAATSSLTVMPLYHRQQVGVQVSYAIK